MCEREKERSGEGARALQISPRFSRQLTCCPEVERKKYQSKLDKETVERRNLLQREAKGAILIRLDGRYEGDTAFAGGKWCHNCVYSASQLLVS